MSNKRDTGTGIKLTKEELELIKENAKRNGFWSMSEYLRFLGTDTTLNVHREVKYD